MPELPSLKRPLPRPAGGGGADEDARVVVVSTVKASVETTERHVRRNLAAGADHLVLCVDDADPEVCARWAGDPYVTAVATDAAYWGGERSDRLARRQGINANLVNLALTLVPGARWLFSLDADECLHIDRSALLDLAPGKRVVRLTTMEAVSRTDADAGTPTDAPVEGTRRYKRQLSDEELEMLVVMGALSEASMGSYFRGHRRKIGVRPDRRLRLFLHEVENPQGTKVPMHRDVARLRVLHDESPTLEEFVRKWSAHVEGGGFHQSPERRAIRDVFVALRENTAATADEVAAVHRRLYERVALDDVALLDALGFLEVPDAARHTHEPQPFSAEDQQRWEAALAAMCSVDKALLSHLPKARPVQALRQAQRHLADRHPDLAAELGASLPRRKRLSRRADDDADDDADQDAGEDENQDDAVAD